MAYSIVIEDVIVGILTDEGKIVSDNPFLKQFGNLEIILPVGDQAGQVVVVKPGDSDYIPAVVEELEEAGYGVVPKPT